MSDVLQISPSQIESYLGCPRKWWWKHVVSMPVMENQQQFIDGNVVHAVCERFMMADDNGRVPCPPAKKAQPDDSKVWAEGPLTGQRAGDAVEIYPSGWDAPLRSPAKAGHIRKVVKVAIETGVLVRYPNRIVEKGYKREVIPGVRMSGRMDVEHPNGIDDHKTTSAKKWCSSEKDLANDPKMLCYGHEWLERWRTSWGEGNDPDFVTLRLNYFGKDPNDPFTKHVEVDVESEAVEDWWEETVLPAAKEMLDLANSDLVEKDWTEVEGPRKTGECRKYGGCDFAPVCSRVRAPAAHRRIIDRANGKRPKSKPKSIGENKMSLFSKGRNRAGGVPSTSVKEAPPPTEAAETGGVAAVEVEEASIQGRAPWANPSCKACEGSGISSKNTVCFSCDTIAGRKKKPTSADFKVWNDEDGNLCWADKNESADVEGKATRTAKEAKNTTKKRTTRARKNAEPKEEPELVDVPEVEATEPKEKPKPKKVTATAAKAAPKKENKKGKKSKDDDTQVERPEVVPGLVLLINAVYLKAPESEVVDLHDILAEEGASMAQDFVEKLDKDVDSFYQINPWDRKDLMGRCIGEIARELENTTVMAVGSSQDFKMMVDLLRPYAEVVIGGML